MQLDRRPDGYLGERRAGGFAVQRTADWRASGRAGGRVDGVKGGQRAGGGEGRTKGGFGCLPIELSNQSVRTVSLKAIPSQASCSLLRFLSIYLLL